MNDAVEHRHSHTVFSADPRPVLGVAEGQVFRLEARSLLTDGAFERSRDYTDLAIPVTGPVLFEGVAAGEVVRVQVHAIDIADRGAMVTLPGRGGFSAPLATAGRIVPIVDGHARFAEGFDVPVRPMVGKIGVGVPGPAPDSSTVGLHGGNIDCKDLTAGASILLTAQVDGAAFYAGDLHACQGDGESSLTAVEIEGVVTLSWHRVDLPPALFPRPVVLTADERVLMIGDGPDLGAAATTALDDLQRLLVWALGWTPEEAAMFISIAADLGVCQVVNARASAKAGLPATYLRDSSAAALVGLGSRAVLEGQPTHWR
ncbi:MAG: acetamidase/formamidase family protein [Nocardioidaceae bacterium]|nr:acetamidase/formamidase family protein [Nocardioidaceae bacterium]